MTQHLCLHPATGSLQADHAVEICAENAPW